MLVETQVWESLTGWIVGERRLRKVFLGKEWAHALPAGVTKKVTLALLKNQAIFFP